MARENSSRRGRNAADTAAVAAEVRTEVRLPSESVQFYIAGDILAGYVFVNKRVPLVVTGVTAENFEAVRARLSDLYGDHKTVCTASSEGGVRECALSQLPPGDYEYLRFGGKRLTARRRFDFSDLVEIMMALRAEGGCEWDRAQTHESIRINLIEEAYELVDAIDKGSREMMLEEAGDVLLQAVFHTQIALDNSEFGYSDMLTALCRKLLDRHTHIFGSNHAENAEQALGFWTEAKKKEKKYSSDADAMSRVPRCLPALLFAEKVQKIASRSGYDWKDAASAAERSKRNSANSSPRARTSVSKKRAICCLPPSMPSGFRASSPRPRSAPPRISSKGGSPPPKSSRQRTAKSFRIALPPNSTRSGTQSRKQKKTRIDDGILRT